MKERILLIDDDELVVKTLNRLLTAQGYQVETANSALEAVSKVAVFDFDLVVSDIRMPDKNTHAPCASAASQELDAPVLAGGV